MTTGIAHRAPLASGSARKATQKALPRAGVVSSAEKVCRILRVATQATRRLTAIADETGLDKATTLRILDTLVRQGLLTRSGDSGKLYGTGPELLAIGARAFSQNDLRPIARPSLLRLAEAFGDTSTLWLARGTEVMCLDIEIGKFPISANFIGVGGTRPLGVGAGSLAVMAWMPQSELDVLWPRVDLQPARWPRLNRPMIEKLLPRFRAQGYTFLLDALVEKMGGLAVPILGIDGRPVGALSVAALSERITARKAELATALQREAAICQAQLGVVPPTPAEAVRKRSVRKQQA